MSTFEQHLSSSQASAEYQRRYEQDQGRYEQEQVPPSSPMGPPPSSITSSKPKKAPSITPRRFTRFFTPSSILNSRSQSGKSGRQLRDITRNANNRKTLEPLGTDAFDSVHFQTPRKKRKILPTPESSPVNPLSSPCRPGDYALPSPISALSPDHDDDYMSLDDHLDPQEESPKSFPLPIRRLNQNGTNSRLVHRSFGGSRALQRGTTLDHCSSWQSQTPNFYSSPDDCHTFRGAALPFCVTPCHSNPLIAIGDEEGGIRLIDSTSADKQSFTRTHLSFHPHNNAVMDIAFSSDDFLFATASGDQTGRIVDMRTQQTRYTMHGHTSSVKQVCFQPGNDMIVATSSRDGSVKIWDLRCSGAEAPAADFSVAFEPGNDLMANPAVDRTVRYAETINFFRDAHSTCVPASNTTITASSRATTPNDTFGASRTTSSTAISSRRTDISITAMSFLSPSHSHLLLTASEANASVKLWDIRGKHTFRSSKDTFKPSVPISSTVSPPSHIRNRHFGINSLALSSDGARFYALCRDSTVYAYSTNHLILGHAPEFTTPSASSKWGRPAPERAGMGPLYGFRHEQFRATSFYVKAALRRASGNQSEMLAVGSSDGCAVLFPTDEMLLPRRAQVHDDNYGHGEDENEEEEEEQEEEDDDGLPTLATIRRKSPSPAAKVTTSTDEGLPIYSQATPLVRGHTSEVTSLTWTHEGELVTLGDDFLARCWREDGTKARELRQGGEVNGQRWGCGWADVAEDWDEDDG